MHDTHLCLIVYYTDIYPAWNKIDLTPYNVIMLKLGVYNVNVKSKECIQDILAISLN